MLDQTILLADGRTLGFAEYGDLEGKPLILCHGQPGNRFFRPDESVSRQAGVRLIVPDRPGYGLSTSQPGRKILDWPLDISALADHLGFEKVYLVGYSAGGPYALACAHAIPGRIEKLAIVSGAPPMTARSLRKQMPPLVKVNYLLTRYAKPLMRLIFWAYWQRAQANPDELITLTEKQAPPEDQQLINTPEVREMLSAVWVENLRTDSLGYVYDAEILMEEWGFSLKEIETLIDFWWGELDKNVPSAIMDYFTSRVLFCRKHLVPDIGHFCLLSSWNQILTSLLT